MPVGLVRLRREGRARAALLDGGWLDYAEVGRLRGVSENAARFALHKAAERRAVLLVQNDGATLVPAFQLDGDGQVREELLTVLEPLLAAGMDPWRAWIWLTSPAALLGGAVPHEAARDPEELPLVQRAAVALAERARRWTLTPSDPPTHKAPPLPAREGPCVVVLAVCQSVTTATPSIRTGLFFATTIRSLPFCGSSSRKVRSWL